MCDILWGALAVALLLFHWCHVADWEPARRRRRV